MAFFIQIMKTSFMYDLKMIFLNTTHFVHKVAARALLKFADIIFVFQVKQNGELWRALETIPYMKVFIYLVCRTRGSKVAFTYGNLLQYFSFDISSYTEATAETRNCRSVIYWDTPVQQEG